MIVKLLDDHFLVLVLLLLFVDLFGVLLELNFERVNLELGIKVLCVQLVKLNPKFVVKLTYLIAFHFSLYF